MGGGGCIVVWYFIVMSYYRTPTQQLDSETQKLQDLYNLYDDDQYIDDLTLDQVKDLILEIENQYLIIKNLVDFAGVRSQAARNRVVTNLRESRTQYHHAGGRTIADELEQMEQTRTRTETEVDAYARRRKNHGNSSAVAHSGGSATLYHLHF